MTAAVTVKALTLARDARPLLQNLSFSIQPGELTAITGRNGVGKTTLLQTLAQLLTPLAGQIDYSAISRHDIRYLGHQNGLWPFLTVFENAQMVAALQGVTDTAVIASALQFFDMHQHRANLISQCSAGQRRRLALAQLLYAPGKLWLLDEPWTALDADASAKLWQLIQQHLKNEGMICLTSHKILKHDVITIKEISLLHAH